MTEDRCQNREIGPVVVRYGGTMPRLKMRQGERIEGEKFRRSDDQKIRRQMTDDRGQMTEDRGQMTEDR
ncbi:hypothetical protein JY97_07355 [Alkalispirochaeta odontotermitis]|nr:hypothetical protein JY97_07355 [Alkalispirochaeta odontotermitis]CAB1076693.1 hypothetical protein D1AOALGA4SA_4488 [Olavius algarvensis Delta 1 endosymbiont]